MRHIAIILGTLVFLSGVFTEAHAEVKLSKGQTVYVPAYSHVYIGFKKKPFDLAVTLMIRNTDPKLALTITAVEYFDDHGKLVKRMIKEPVKLGPMASMSSFVEEGDQTGGIGANFIVRWRGDKEMNPPIIESVMIGGKGGQGISFISPGQEITE